jgi:hypothetical protein
VPLVQPYFTDPVDEATLVTAINDVIASVKNGAHYSYSYTLGQPAMHVKTACVTRMWSRMRTGS